MPPHCDSLSGPVVKMAKKALETGNVKFILPYVPEESEDEVIAAFHKVLPLAAQAWTQHTRARLPHFLQHIASNTAYAQSAFQLRWQ